MHNHHSGNLIIICLVTLQLFACGQERVKEAHGFIVYILPSRIRFVETKRLPNTNYKESFATNNFSGAYSFKPDITLEQSIRKISSDTLFDENPELKEHARFLKEVIVFPAQVRFKLIAGKGISKITSKFKMTYNGELVEFNYNELEGEVIEVKRLSKGP